MATKDETAGQHHRLNGNDSEQAPGGGEGRTAWRAAVHGAAESDTADGLNNRDKSGA